MLSVATLTTVICKVDTDNILNSSTFKAGMSACICITGCCVAADDTFVSNNIDWIKDTAGEVIQGSSNAAVIFFFASALLCCSQAATAKSTDADGSGAERFSADRCCFFCCGVWSVHSADLPTLVAAVQMDDTGTTRIGKNSSSTIRFFIAGTLGVATAVCFGFVLGSFVAVMTHRGAFTPAFFPPTNILSPSVV